MSSLEYKNLRILDLKNLRILEDIFLRIYEYAPIKRAAMLQYGSFLILWGLEGILLEEIPTHIHS